MHEEVAYEHHHRVAVPHVRYIIPPVAKPILHPGRCCPFLETTLEFRGL